MSGITTRTFFPRFPGDNLYGSLPEQEFAAAERRSVYADKLRNHFASQSRAKTEIVR